MVVGKQGRANRVTEKVGVRAVQGIFEDGGCLFQPVDLAEDIGKDAYVDLTEDGKHFTGSLIAVQIKSGVSFKDGDNYKIPCKPADIVVWRGSTVPIYGMVYDPDRNSVHWENLTAWASNLAEGSFPTSCPVPASNFLSDETLPLFVKQVRFHIERSQPRILDLASTDAVKQMGAVSDCLAFGRSDARPLLLLRASIRWLEDPDALWPAIQILSLVTPHPDIYWVKDNWLPDEIRYEVKASFSWSLEEAEALLAAPAGDMWGRGDLGQGVYMLLDADPDCDQLLERVVMTTSDDDVRWQAASLRVGRADEHGLAVLQDLVNRAPRLSGAHVFAQLEQTLRDHGSVSLF